MAEPSQIRRSIATEVGADRAIDPNSEDLAALFGEDLLRPEYVLEGAGAPSGVDMAVEPVRPRGGVTLVGVPTDLLKLPSLRFLRKEATMVGSVSSVEEFPIAVRLLVRKAFELENLSSDVVPLESFEGAFQRPARGEAIKIMLPPSE